jgi:hypothetical protein
MNDQQTNAYMKALIEERGFYIARGWPEKVAAVDAELARVGHQAAPPVKRATRRAK